MCGRAYSPRFLLDVAERAHQRDGRRAGRQRARHGQARPARGPRRKLVGRGSARSSAPILGKYEDQGIPTTPPRASGTTASSTRPTDPHGPGLALAARAQRADPGAALRRVPDVSREPAVTTTLSTPQTPLPAPSWSPTAGDRLPRHRYPARRLGAPRRLPCAPTPTPGAPASVRRRRRRRADIGPTAAARKLPVGPKDHRLLPRPRAPRPSTPATASLARTVDFAEAG